MVFREVDIRLLRASSVKIFDNYNSVIIIIIIIIITTYFLFLFDNDLFIPRFQNPEASQY
jgi:hypothetical protein